MQTGGLKPSGKYEKNMVNYGAKQIIMLGKRSNFMTGKLWKTHLSTLKTGWEANCEFINE